MIPEEFHHDFWQQKIRDLALSCGVVSVTPRLAVLTEHRFVTDIRIHCRSIYRSSLASHVKKWSVTDELLVTSLFRGFISARILCKLIRYDTMY